MLDLHDRLTVLEGASVFNRCRLRLEFDDKEARLPIGNMRFRCEALTVRGFCFRDCALNTVREGGAVATDRHIILYVPAQFDDDELSILLLGVPRVIVKFEV